MRAPAETLIAYATEPGTVAADGVGTRRLNEFQIDETEVTVAAFRECVRAGGCEEPQSGGACNWGRGLARACS